MPFTVDQTGLYTIDSHQAYDGHLHLYANAFDPAAPLNNCLAANDDFFPHPDPFYRSRLVDVALTPGITYIVVTSGFANHDFGQFENSLSGPGAIHLPNTIPYWFPRLVNEPGQRVEGYAFANPGTESAVLRFAAFGPDGQPVGTPATRGWPGGHQAAYQADGLLELTGQAEGWVEVTTEHPGLSGLFMSQIYQPGLGMDGASVALAGTADGVFSRVAVGSGFETELLLANPTAATVTVSLTLLRVDGPLDLGDRSLPARGMERLTLGQLAPAKSGPYEGAVRVVATGRIVGNAQICHQAGTLSSLNLQPVSGAARRLYAPHAVNLPNDYDTTVQLVNVGPGPAEVTVKVFRADGTPGAADANLSIPEGAWTHLTETDLGLTPGFEGWLQVDSTGAPLVGSVTFGQPGFRAYESTLPLPAGGLREACFAQVANGPVGGIDYFTGLAVLNPQPEAVEVTIQVYHPDGRPNGNEVRQTLAVGEKYVRLLPFMEGIGNLDPQGSGYLTVTAAQPVQSFVLFGNSGGEFLSAVPATHWAAGDRYAVDPIVGELLVVPGGTIRQGSAADEPCRVADETPFQHTLSHDLAVMATEATQGMWAALRAVQPSLPEDPSNLTFGSGVHHPVQRVTWFEAILFANLLSQQQGLDPCYHADPAFTTPITAANYTAGVYFCHFEANGYRLLTEGEWENACRAGSTTPFAIPEPNYTAGNCGDPSTPGLYPALESLMWFAANRYDPAGNNTSKPVATRQPNAWGLYDMHGNVWEWCWDWYAPQYPTNTGRDYRGSPAGTHRVPRGGCWRYDAWDCRSSVRGWDFPGSRFYDLGFRLARRIR